VLPPELSALLDAVDPEAREAAWQAFLETYGRLLLHTARGVGRDYDAAMDAYAHLLEQLRRDDCRRLRAYTPTERAKFTTWLVTVSRRLCVDHLRRRYGRAADAPAGTPAAGQQAARRQLADLLAAEVDIDVLPDSTAADPQARLQAEALTRAVVAALGELAPRDRLLLKLRFEDDLSAREIGRILRFPTPFHVYRRLNLLLARLRELLRRRGVHGPEP
jgi:RNA polymerase sigma factor (sigma-70 family)